MLKLNPAIEILKQDKYYYLRNQENSNIFRVAETEHQILQLLTTNLSIEEIKERLKSKSKITDEEIQKFRTHLLELSILIKPSDGKEANRIKPFKVNIFHLRIPLLNPSRFLEWVVRLKITRYLFTLPSLLHILSIIGAGILIFLRNRGAFLSFKTLFQAPQYIPIILIVFLTMALLHEFAHGFVCTYYGGKAKEIGIGIFYFIPTFYISLAGIWLFKKKTHRILTYLSGLLMDIFVCSLFIISYQLFPQANIILLLSRIFIFSVLIRSIFIINPFIESDFYRILTHYSNTPILRQRILMSVYSIIRGRKENNCKKSNKGRRRLMTKV